jgi:ribosomal protein S21
MPNATQVRHDAVEVEIREGDFEWALKTFCRRWKNSGLIRELVRRRDFPSMADRRREKARRAVSRRRRGRLSSI